MLDRDYTEAMNAYDGASFIEPSADLEEKARLARAWVNLHQARAAISRGDLLAAEGHLQTALFNAPLPDAKGKLQAMAPAFEAARTVRTADRAVERSELDEALRLYRLALPNLPAPADEHVRRKILRAEAIQLGERLYAEENWMGAIQAFEKALRFGPDPAIEDRLLRAKARLPELPSETGQKDDAP
jgi:tetratricopeptide (TPR) repeat protein